LVDCIVVGGGIATIAAATVEKVVAEQVPKIKKKLCPSHTYVYVHINY
jgi:hypothetical protein